MKRIEHDTTENKEGSLLRLKIHCLETQIFFNSKDFKTNDIMKLCDAYKVNYSKNMKKEQLAKRTNNGF